MPQPKQCIVCDKMFCNKSSLNKHVKSKKHLKMVEKAKIEIDKTDNPTEPNMEDIMDKPEEEEVIIKESIIINPVSDQEIKNIDIMKQIDEDIKSIKWEKLDKNTFDFFDPHARSMCVIGSSFCGKSTFVFKVADMMFNTNDILTIAMLDNPQADVYNTLPRSYQIVDTFRADLVKAMHSIAKKTKNKFKFGVILDDIIDLRYSNTLRSMLLSWRNSRISSILSLQDVSLVSRSMKNSISYLCLRNNTDMGVVETLMKNYIGYRDIFFKKKTMNEKIMLFTTLMKDKENTIVLDNIKGELRFVKYKL